MDIQFPIIEYASGSTPKNWGRAHGESWRTAIQELVKIRTKLMREKNARLDSALIESLAQEQWHLTQKFDVDLADEVEGIAEGAAVSISDMVVLNNYTDFRDIEVPDQGCSAIYVHRNGNRVAGQTWDMHGSAKRYVCCIQIPAADDRPELIVFSLVGCVGMMGYSGTGQMVGVNNLNTVGAKPGVLWPVLIRRLLQTPDRQAQRSLLKSRLLTSGRSFLLAGRDGGEFWEVSPSADEMVSQLNGETEGCLFHTNHCLSETVRQQEARVAMTSTTHVRYELIEKKIGDVVDLETASQLLNDHEGYPRSICSNFQTHSQDPSITCGGAIGDLNTGLVRMWRGDPLHDANFVQHEFQLEST